MRDQSGTLTATPADEAKKSWLEQRFAGSFAELSTYVGSGTFYTSGYHDPYVSNALYVRPTFVIGTKYKLTLNARLYGEEEYTLPDNPNGRSFNPLDSWIFLTAKNLYTMPRAKVRFSGSVRSVVPISYESRYSHLLTAVGASGAASRVFELGTPDSQGKRWTLVTALNAGFTKAIRTSALRGHFPGDTSGCRTVGPAGPSGGGGVADTDRCGGPLNTSYTIASSGTVALSRGRYSASVTLIVINEFKYAIDADTQYELANVPGGTGSVPRGRADATWGLIGLGYDVTDHWALSLGLASLQPALDSRYQHLRFPFFDFDGANANNFTQVFLSVTGTL